MWKINTLLKGVATILLLPYSALSIYHGGRHYLRAAYNAASVCTPIRACVLTVWQSLSDITGQLVLGQKNCDRQRMSIVSLKLCLGSTCLPFKPP